MAHLGICIIKQRIVHRIRPISKQNIISLYVPKYNIINRLILLAAQENFHPYQGVLKEIEILPIIISITPRHITSPAVLVYSY